MKVTGISMHEAVAVREPSRGGLRAALRLAVWVLGVPAFLLVALYAVLLITPIPLPFLRDQVRAAVMQNLPPGYGIELGGVSIAVEGGVMPVLQFAPVVLTDSATAARIEMDAMQVGFSPLKAIVGQPGAVVTLVAPRIQVVQDLLGPRLAFFEVIDDPAAGTATVRIKEGTHTYPSVSILGDGLTTRGVGPDGMPVQLRSDNEWLIHNFEAGEQGMASIIEQARAGRFSRLVIRDARIEMHEPVYGVLRSFDDVDLDLTPSIDGSRTVGRFGTTIAGVRMEGTVERSTDLDGTTHLISRGTDMDFAAMVPFVEDTSSGAYLEGTGAFLTDIEFAPETGKATVGRFSIDLTGIVMRVGREKFPVAGKPLVVAWSPEEGTFTLEPTEINIAGSTAMLSGMMRLGMDDHFGPIMALQVKAADVWLRHPDLPEPAAPFETIEFSGWSAPLYGAMGVDQLVLTKGDARIATTGRVDMLRQGMGLDVTLAGQGLTMEDLKRLWPGFVLAPAREWFVKNITAGTVETASMKLAFPAGSFDLLGGKPVPEDALLIDIQGTGVVISPVDGLAPVTIDGQSRVTVRGNKVALNFDGATVDTGNGPLKVDDAAFVIDSSVPGARIFEISGDVDGGVPSLIALLQRYQPQMVTPEALPVDLASVTGGVDANLVATIQMGENDAVTAIDYAINGQVADFGIGTPVMGYAVGDGQLTFRASPTGYRIGGTAAVGEVEAGVVIEGSLAQDGNVLVSATVDTADLKSMGFDLSEFITGDVRVVGKPMADGAIQIAVNLEDAALTIKDLGIAKAAGSEGRLDAVVRQTADLVSLTGVDLAFGDVRVQGKVDVDPAGKLRSAEFSTIQISPGDNAQLALSPVSGGYQLRVRGEQLDLKPMLARFFSLGGEGGTGGPQATSISDKIVLDIALDRALGFYRTTAYNLDVNMTLDGADLENVSLSAQLGNNSSISIATNPDPNGQVMTVAFNDLGSVLRLMGIYPQLAGGQGTLVLASNPEVKRSNGELILRNFSVDENSIAGLANSASNSRSSGSGDRMNFTSGRVSFNITESRVEISEAVLTGPSHGGTLRGYIHTAAKQYDLTGTYIPLSGINTLFQRLPIFGALLGGREGEGLIGVTFAVRGPLDKPEFMVNPASILAVGAFRSLFEFRAREEPTVAAQQR